MSKLCVEDAGCSVIVNSRHRSRTIELPRAHKFIVNAICHHRGAEGAAAARNAAGKKREPPDVVRDVTGSHLQV